MIYRYLLLRYECDRIDKNKEIIDKFVIDGFEYSTDNVESETLEVIYKRYFIEVKVEEDTDIAWQSLYY